MSRPPELLGCARSKNQHDKSLNIGMSYMLILPKSTCYWHIHSKALGIEVRYFNVDSAYLRGKCVLTYFSQSVSCFESVHKMAVFLRGDKFYESHIMVGFV